MNTQNTQSTPPVLATESAEDINHIFTDQNPLGSRVAETQIEPTPKVETPEEAQKRTAIYTRVLRWIGASILGIAAICFLIGGWANASDLHRTYGFLGFTALLTAAGVFCTYRWRDDKGARTFMAIATAFLPANFAQVGGLIYAKVKAPVLHEGLRDHFSFGVLNTQDLVIVGLISLIVLAPIAFLGFSALARSGAKKMTALFILGNAALLLPWRSANLIAGLGFALCAILVYADRKWFAKVTALQTWDGIAMRTLLFAPAGLFIVRNLVMHGPTLSLVGLIFGLLSALFFLGIPRCLPGKQSASASQLAAHAFSFAAWSCLVFEFFAPDSIFNGLPLSLLFLPWCILVFSLSFIGAGRGAFTRGMVSIVASGTCWADIANLGGYGPSITCILVAVALILAAFVLEEKVILASGLGALGVGIAYHLHFAMMLVQTNLWLSLAAAGMVVILASSFLERHGPTIRGRSRQLRERWQGWN
ncbi:hypothetical protein [Rubellicoccus peritrichatus]|uniref:DUF4401 domain-containing protein n=1 Tax=Rubellicoccus peritrichatus TaxID=3080537 RepID=A0AAQ3L7P5_9BACT|nr:hypothetical protein [Puniceicoccus sp. CR14]WOO40182.1 hypothetical protein RZN69_16295 [Puniceicoccus sp. CR14]